MIVSFFFSSRHHTGDTYLSGFGALYAALASSSRATSHVSSRRLFLFIAYMNKISKHLAFLVFFFSWTNTTEDQFIFIFFLCSSVIFLPYV